MSHRPVRYYGPGRRVARWWKSPRVRALRHRVSDLQKLLFPALGLLVRLWKSAMDRGVEYRGYGPLFDYLRRGRPCIIVMWHQDVFVLMFEMFRHTPTYPSMFMVSHGRVGTIGRYLLAIWGIDCVAGSGPRRGGEAVVELARRAKKEQRSVFIMADGSRGPAREVRWGALRLAALSGLPIIAARAWGDRLVTLRRSWMKLVLPKPWGRAVVVSAPPLSVPEGMEQADELEAFRIQLQQRLDGLVDEAERRLEEWVQE